MLTTVQNLPLPPSPSSSPLSHPEDPLLIVENLLSISGVQRPQDWPPFPLYGFDNGVDEGWYGYRHSAASTCSVGTAHLAPQRGVHSGFPASVTVVLYRSAGGLHHTPPMRFGPWTKFSSSPNGSKHSRWIPKIPSRPRRRLRAWFATLSAAEKTAVIGLRVRWNWTDAHMRQAPDTKEFRIYYGADG